MSLSIFKREKKPSLDSVSVETTEVETKSQEIIAKAEAAAREKSERLDRREERLDERDEKLSAREGLLEQKLAEVEKLNQERLAKLEEVSSLSPDEAREALLESLEKELANEVTAKIKTAEEEAKRESDRRTREIIVEAIQRSATDYVAEATTTVVKLPDEEMKGRIIGREGRNIKALERATGADFDIDETPGEVRVSSLDPVRREVAKIVLERLIADGRIQPSRIEETVERVRADIEREALEVGRDAAYRVGLNDLPADVLTLLGKLKYRTSYGQNQLEHSFEVTNLATALAQSVGADVELTKTAALLHDIGKVKTVEEEEGSHTEIGREILTKAGLDEAIIHASMAHHQDEEFKSVEAVLVYVADAISGNRPGARYEDYGAYVKRIEQLEEIAKSFSGVADAYAVSAGREVRVIVRPEDIDDAQTVVLARDIVKRIEKEAKYPGVVKVNVIRETRAVETAK